MYEKPKYTLFKNTLYAVDGLVDIFKSEKSFKLQLLFFLIMSMVSFFLNIDIYSKFALFMSLMLPLFCEIVNSAIERVVDLVTTDYNVMAKRAKDAGAAVVFVSFIITFLVWCFVIYINFIRG